MTAAKKLTPEEHKKQDDKIDRQMKDSFPASDPPSYSGGSHAGGPRHSVPDGKRSKKTG